MPSPIERCTRTNQTATLSRPRYLGQPVFSRSAFAGVVKRGEPERLCLFFREILPSLAKRAFKNVALAASTLALENRERYDSMGFIESFDVPFIWTDPAEAMLSLQRTSEVHHIISSYPCSVPHILIELAGGNDSEIIQGNSSPPQCHKHLAIFHAHPATFQEDDEDSEIDCASFFAELSDDDSSSPDTPTSIRRVGRCDFFGTNEERLDEVHDYTLYQQSRSEHLGNELVISHNDVKMKFFIDEDEDDGPPEYDDWFLSIAERTRFL